MIQLVLDGNVCGLGYSQVFLSTTFGTAILLVILDGLLTQWLNVSYFSV
jgi:hypothetical protein